MSTCVGSGVGQNVVVLCHRATRCMGWKPCRVHKPTKDDHVVLRERTDVPSLAILVSNSWRGRSSG